MREIKFRMWHKVQKKMYSAEELGKDQLTLMPDGRGFVNVSSDSLKQSQIDEGRVSIPLQYTGLKDKNGKEIYEGDIIKTNGGGYGDSICQVNYAKNLAGFYLLCNSYNMSFSSIGLLFTEVIGNIYENPKMAKEENIEQRDKERRS